MGSAIWTDFRVAIGRSVQFLVERVLAAQDVLFFFQMYAVSSHNTQLALGDSKAIQPAKTVHRLYNGCGTVGAAVRLAVLAIVAYFRG